MLSFTVVSLLSASDCIATLRMTRLLDYINRLLKIHRTIPTDLRHISRTAYMKTIGAIRSIHSISQSDQTDQC